MKSNEDVYKWLNDNYFISNGCEGIIQKHYCTPDRKYLISLIYKELYIYEYSNGLKYLKLKCYYEYDKIDNMKVSKDFHMYFRKFKIDSLI